MASIRQEIHVEAGAEQVWDAIADVGAVHTRLAPGFVIDT
ncbi:MAG TPA: SRPBCC family protein, partial [Methylomirabilota bacterium]|nr:SRPBCC family protein [Methylomirabilota bacterium]